MKKQLLILGMFAAMVLASCGGSNTQSTDQAAADRQASADANKTAAAPSYDPNRGEGKFTQVDIGPLNASMATSGEKVYEVKCASCHKLTDEKLVGPGWKGVTTRHKPEWIMNFVTNTDAMLDKDPKAQAMLEICLVRMPNQNLTDQEARDVLEFMRKNDGAK